MDNIIPITQTQIGSENINSVNSREIYSYLGVKQQYADWIKLAIEKYDFVESGDFTIHKFVNGKATQKDYIVSIDMAKELCMVSNTPKGKETRKYFLSIEKQSQKVLTTSEQIALIAQGHQEIDSRITKLEETKRLENWQEKSLKDAVHAKAYAIANEGKENKAYISKLHRNIWKLFKNNFHLPRYNELPAVKYEDGLRFINSLTIADMV